MKNTTRNTQTIKNSVVVENIKKPELTNEQIKAMYKEIRKNEKEQKQQKKAINKENHLIRIDLKNQIKELRKQRKELSSQIVVLKAKIKNLRD